MCKSTLSEGRGAVDARARVNACLQGGHGEGDRMGCGCWRSLSHALQAGAVWGVCLRGGRPELINCIPPGTTVESGEIWNRLIKVWRV